MRLQKIIYTTVVILMCFFSQKTFSQDDRASGKSRNIPVNGEKHIVNSGSTDNGIISSMDKVYRKHLADGNYSEAEKIKQEMEKLIPPENLSTLIPDPDGIKILKQNSDPEPDWLTENPVIHNGIISEVPEYPNQIAMKMGEDSSLYSVVSSPGGPFTNLNIYRSSDYGNSWMQVISYGITGFISNISMIVESKNNSIGDSTRIIVFYAVSQVSGITYAGSSINFLSIRRNGQNFKGGIIAHPEAGNKFTGISAVTDGAFWQGPTYFGVVCTESDNTTGVTKKFKFYRTIDWGSTWVNSVITTSFNDRFPSACYKEGSSDSIYIAVQRVFDSTESQIRVLATPWNPSGSYGIYYLTDAPDVKYERPCLAIRQINPGNSFLITCTRNNLPLYHYSTNGGGLWYTDFALNNGNYSKKLFTYCTSSIDPVTPFSACVLNTGGDSVNVRRGELGSLGEVVNKVNTFPCKLTVSPVCEKINRSGKSFTIVAYPRSNGNVFSTQERLKKIILKAFPQGFYNAATNRLNASDTIRIFLRNNNTPYQIIDSSKGIFDTVNFTCNFSFTDFNDGMFYVEIKHRNSLETWTKTPLNFYNAGDQILDFASFADVAYGNNEIQTGSNPVRFGLYGGDVFRDGVIDLSDVIKINNDANSFVTGYALSDLTGNSIVDLTDVVTGYNNASAFVSIKRP